MTLSGRGSLSLRLTSVVVLGAVLTTACGGDDDKKKAAAPTNTPVAAAVSSAPAASSDSASSTVAPSAAPSAAPAAAGTGRCKPEEIKLVVGVRNTSNPYEAMWDKGGKAFAKSVGLAGRYTLLLNDGDSQKQLTQVQSAVAEGGKCTVVNIMPSSSADTESIVKAVKDAGGVVITQWNKPDDLHPKDFGDTWVSHFTFDGNVGGYEIAKAMFEKMGKKGNIVALQGILDNVPAKQRYAGLEKALKEYPDIKLLDQQTAEWDTAKALAVTKTWLTKYGDKIDGIWAANDGMALGATEALRGAGKVGKVQVVGTDAAPDAVAHVQNGEQVATVAYDGYWQGGVGLAMGYQALTGAIDTAKLEPEKREFYAKQSLVTKDNVGDFTAEPVESAYVTEFKTPWSRLDSPITY